MTHTFIETIRFENGFFHLLDRHLQRMEMTVREIYGPGTVVPDIKAALAACARVKCSEVLKYRITYDWKIRNIEVIPYIPRIIRNLKIVESPSCLDYHLKRSDRSQLEALFSCRGACDEVLIIKDGLITDTSYTNVVFKGTEDLYTPRLPLLHGVMRRHLLNEGIVKERDLQLSDIVPGNPLGIAEVFLINAMLPLNAIPPVNVCDVYIS